LRDGLRADSAYDQYTIVLSVADGTPNLNKRIGVLTVIDILMALSMIGHEVVCIDALLVPLYCLAEI
jgi:hypothetical protein